MDIDALADDIRQRMQGVEGAHDFDHTMRVYNLCLHIGGIEGADIGVLRVAALLHDMARAEEDESKGVLCHARLGAERARTVLAGYGADPDFIDRVCHCIGAHRFRNGVEPESLEARVLFDADKLDAIGAIGLARAFVFAGEVGARVHDKHIRVEGTQAYTVEDTAYREFLVKLRYVKGAMLTETGKALAVPRHEYMVAFFDRLNAEVDGLA